MKSLKQLLLLRITQWVLMTKWILHTSDAQYGIIFNVCSVSDMMTMTTMPSINFLNAVWRRLLKTQSVILNVLRREIMIGLWKSLNIVRRSVFIFIIPWRIRIMVNYVFGESYRILSENTVLMRQICWILGYFYRKHGTILHFTMKCLIFTVNYL